MRFEVTVLGSNGALPSAERHASGHFLRSETTDVLLDCAEGTQMRLQAAGLSMGRVELVLITHLHGDHYFGLPALLTSLSLQGRIVPLRIVSPPGLRDKIGPLLDLDRWRLSFPLIFEEHVAEDLALLTTVGELEVYSFPLRHRIPVNGYLLREKPREPNMRKEKIKEYDIPYTAIPEIKAGADYTTPGGKIIRQQELVAPAAPPRSYAYCTDTVYFPELAHYVRGVDILYHEATFLDDMQEEARDKGHSTARQAATTARDAGAGMLLLGHYSARYREVFDHEREARAVFREAYAGRDLYRFSVPFERRGLP